MTKKETARMMDIKEYKTVPEAARLLGLQPRTLYAYIYRRQVIPPKAIERVGTGWLIRADWIKKRQQAQKRASASTSGKAASL